MKHLLGICAALLCGIVILLATTAPAYGNDVVAGAARAMSAEGEKMICKLGFCMGEMVPDDTKREHSVFDLGVSAFSTPSTGVCKVLGFLAVPRPDKYGRAHKQAFERIDKLVLGKYGPPTDEFGSVWNGRATEALKEGRDWMQGLRSGERPFGNFWARNEGASLPDGIDTITLEVQYGFIALMYEFENFKECLADLEAKDAAVEDTDDDQSVGSGKVCALGFCMGEMVPDGTQRGHSVFDIVVATSAPSTGVCRVTGYLPVYYLIEGYGRAHKRAFERIDKLVQDEYGPPQDVWSQFESGLWWQGSKLLSKWRQFGLDSPLPDGIVGITVRAHTEFITLHYGFDNLVECDADRKARDAVDL